LQQCRSYKSTPRLFNKRRVFSKLLRYVLQESLYSIRLRQTLCFARCRPTRITRLACLFVCLSVCTVHRILSSNSNIKKCRKTNSHECFRPAVGVTISDACCAKILFSAIVCHDAFWCVCLFPLPYSKLHDRALIFGNFINVDEQIVFEVCPFFFRQNK